MFGGLKRKDIVGKRIEGIYMIQEGPVSFKLPYDPCVVVLENGLTFELTTGMSRWLRPIKKALRPHEGKRRYSHLGAEFCVGVEILEIVNCVHWASTGLYLANGLILLSYKVSGKHFQGGYWVAWGTERAATYPGLLEVFTSKWHRRLIDACDLRDRCIKRAPITREQVLHHTIEDILQLEPIPNESVLSNPVFARLDNGLIIEPTVLTDKNGKRDIYQIDSGDLVLTSVRLPDDRDCRGERIEDVVALDNGGNGGFILASGKILANDPVGLEKGCPVVYPDELTVDGRTIAALYTGAPITVINSRPVPTGKRAQQAGLRRAAGSRVLTPDEIIGKKIVGLYDTVQRNAYSMTIVELEDGTTFQLSVQETDQSEPFYALRIDKQSIRVPDYIQMESVIGQKIIQIEPGVGDFSSPSLFLSNKHAVHTMMTFTMAMGGCEYEAVGVLVHAPERELGRDEIVNRTILGVYETGGWVDTGKYMLVKIGETEFLEMDLGEDTYNTQFIYGICLIAYDLSGVDLPPAGFLKCCDNCLGKKIVECVYHPKDGRTALLLDNNAALLTGEVKTNGGHQWTEKRFAYVDLNSNPGFLKDFVPVWPVVQTKGVSSFRSE